jgi:Protein of unknown function (DUF3429)
MSLASDLAPDSGRTAPHGIPTAALALGLAGAVPFLVGATLPAFGFTLVAGVPVRVAMLVYGAVILSFLGGIRWGLALREPNVDRQALQFVVSVIPSLVGWVAVLVGTLPGMALLAIAFAAQGLLDLKFTEAGRAPAWFGRLRLLLSVLVVGSLAIAFSFGLRHGTATSFVLPPAHALPHGHPPITPDGPKVGPIRPVEPGLST